MNKKYIIPTIMTVTTDQVILAGSGGGVQTGSSLGNAYNSNDVSYSKRGSSCFIDDYDYDNDDEE